MTPRSLFLIILKVLGVFFIKDVLLLVPTLLSVFLYLTGSDFELAAWTFFSALVLIAIYGIVAYFLVFKTNQIIDKLKLDQGFDREEFSLNIHRSTVLGISVIVVGGLIVADAIPALCRQVFDYFHEKRITHGATNPTLAYAGYSVAEIIIGLLMLGNQRTIVNFIERKRKN